MSDEPDNLPKLECDLVMRGGITSGLVYPEAVAELAKQYRFRCIGGTSAGAIAAAITAAAEYGRLKILKRAGAQEAEKTFEFIAKIPKKLATRYGDQTMLMRLFKPSQKTQPLFRLALAILGRITPASPKGKPAQKAGVNKFEQVGDRAMAIIKATVRAFPKSSAIGAIPGFLLGFAIAAGTTRRYWESENPVHSEAVQSLLGPYILTGFKMTNVDMTYWFAVSCISALGLIVGWVMAFWAFRRASTALSALVFVFGVFLGLHLSFYDSIDLAKAHNVDVLSQLGALFGLIISAFAALVGALLAASTMMLRRAYRALPENMYGICTGKADPDEFGIPGVTDWTHKIIQAVAGRTENEKPLTVGDLWKPEGFDGDPAQLPHEKREIELSLMTTNVTRGISHRFPFIEGWRGSLYFKKDELLKLFPEVVVNHMVQYSEPAEDEVKIEPNMYRLPAAQHLPILFGTRISMSFPLLLSAVPLYAVDWAEQDEEKKFRLKKCWFSDGGLTSNFPINIFDTTLPTRPTFGINLVPDTARHYEVALKEVVDGPVRKFNPEVFDFEGRKEETKEAAAEDFKPNGATPPPADVDPWDDIWMPRRNDQDLFKVIRFNEFGGVKGSVRGFFEAIFDTARNWADTELAHMPGYRDRIVHVELKPNEGGLNLDMPEDVIRSVGRKGRLAGKLLAARFAPEPGPDPQWNEEIQLTWDNHRWVRYRSAMAALEHVIRDLAGRLQERHPLRDSIKTYEELLDESFYNASHYGWASKEQFDFARQITIQLEQLVGTWTKDYETFDRVHGHEPGRDGYAPRPKAGFKIMPPSDADPQRETVPRVLTQQDLSGSPNDKRPI